MATTWNKPAGLPVFPPHGEPDGDSVLARLLRDQPARAALAWPEGFEGGIAHRLDNSTSGALWVADDVRELGVLRDAFQGGRLTKTYLMRTSRVVGWTENTCDRAIAHDAQKRRRMIVQRGESTPHRGAWYPAHTRFVRRHDDVWQVQITTGVMHQIRVHAAFLGIPLLGDSLYGGGATPDDSPEGLTFFLHHVGLAGAGLQTAPVPDPEWAHPRSTITGA